MRSPAGFIWQHARRPLDVCVGGVLSLPAEFDPRTQAARDITKDQLRPWIDYWRLYQEGKRQAVIGKGRSRMDYSVIRGFASRR